VPAELLVISALLTVSVPLLSMPPVSLPAPWVIVRALIVAVDPESAAHQSPA